ncbi:MAG: hypothetical protein U1E67_11610 [Hyphomicrobiales bacterium]
MTKQVTIIATHPRSGWTRMAGTVVPLCEGPSTADAISEFDALQCIEAGQGEWAAEAASVEAKPQRRT